MSSSTKSISKVAITGPESTGKSTIAKALAAHFHTSWVPEYARDYIKKLDNSYRKEDLLKIAAGQLALEGEQAKSANSPLFCDTDLLVIKIWYEYKYGVVDPFIIEQYQQTHYDLYLLMDIDLPWHYDPQREHPEKRRFFFEWFERELIRKKANYVIVHGSHEERLQNAIINVNQMLG